MGNAKRVTKRVDWEKWALGATLKGLGNSTVPACAVERAQRCQVHTLSLWSMERQNISSGSPYEPRVGFSRAVRVGDHVHVAGTAPIWPDGFVDPDPKVQTTRCIEIMLAALEEAGGTPEDVVRTRMFITDAGDEPAIGEAHGEVFSNIRPAATMVVVAALLDPRWKVEMELEAVLTG